MSNFAIKVLFADSGYKAFTVVLETDRKHVAQNHFDELGPVLRRIGYKSQLLELTEGKNVIPDNRSYLTDVELDPEVRNLARKILRLSRSGLNEGQFQIIEETLHEDWEGAVAAAECELADR